MVDLYFKPFISSKKRHKFGLPPSVNKIESPSEGSPNFTVYKYERFEIKKTSLKRFQVMFVGGKSYTDFLLYVLNVRF